MLVLLLLLLCISIVNTSAYYNSSTHFVMISQ